MGIPLLFFLLFMRLMSAEIKGDRSLDDDECMAWRCSHHGPVIWFPFRLKQQLDHCGLPGFELYCSEKKNQTILELSSNSVKLWVTKIDYTSQEIVTRLSDYCPQRQIVDLNLSASTSSSQTTTL